MDRERDHEMDFKMNLWTLESHKWKAGEHQTKNENRALDAIVPDTMQTTLRAQRYNKRVEIVGNWIISPACVKEKQLEWMQCKANNLRVSAQYLRLMTLIHCIEWLR